MRWIILLFITGSLFAKDINYTDLYRFLPDIKNYKCENPTGSKLQTPQGDAITVEKQCFNNNARIKFSIVTGSMAKITGAQYVYIMEFDSPEEYVKTTTIQGAKTILHYFKQEKRGSIVSIIKDDLIVNMEYEGIDSREALSIFKNIPIDKLKSLK
ncbi:MAG: hypothetical protein KatS3mg129_1377 [Leptospiraceae bacterium]|nr:MAG: hypothetical protein KatS3mg129_1377 [Leptospiraceae bacterium]